MRMEKVELTAKILKFLKETFIGKDVVSRKEFKELEAVPRRWGILFTLDWYIMREFLIKWSILLLVFVLGFIMGDVFDSLSDFLDANASISQTCSYFLLRLPGNIRFILPISMLLGTIWTMAAFGKNLEVTAMRASGVSLFRCGVPIMVIGFLVSLVNIYFNEALIPYTEHEAALVMAYAKNKKAPQQKMLVYRSTDGERAWFFRIFEEKSFHHNVIFKHYRKDGTLEYDLNIDRAEFIAGKGWKFTDAVRTDYTADGLMPYRPIRLKEVIYSEKDIPENQEDILYAIKDEEDLPSWVIWDILHSTENMSERMKNVYTTLFFYRLAFPWACFLAVFIGIPVVTKNERSGVMTSIMTAVALIIGYIICANLFLLFGKQGVFNPVFAGLAPTVGFIVYGYYKVLMGGGN